MCWGRRSLAALVLKSQGGIAGIHPVKVRINNVSRAEAIDYRNLQYRPQKAENSFTYHAGPSCISRAVASLFNGTSRTHSTSSTATCSDQERKGSIIQAHIKDSSLS